MATTYDFRVALKRHWDSHPSLSALTPLYFSRAQRQDVLPYAVLTEVSSPRTLTSNRTVYSEPTGQISVWDTTSTKVATHHANIVAALPDSLELFVMGLGAVLSIRLMDSITMQEEDNVWQLVVPYVGIISRPKG